MWFGLKIVKEAELQELRTHVQETKRRLESIRLLEPFIREVMRITEVHPEYLDGIAQGTVSIRFLAGYSPFAKHGKREAQS
jgi:hypothetical protein